MARQSSGSSAPGGTINASVLAPTRARKGNAGNTPDFYRSEVLELMPIWKQSREAYIGTRALHANVKAYVPMHPKEKAEDYARRSRFAEFYNAYGRTVRAVVGQPFAKECKLGENVPSVIKDDWENLDGCGTHGDVFVQRWFYEAILMGCAGVLVDAPSTPPGLNRKQEEDAGVRPYWIRFLPEDIINWRYSTVKGKRVLTMLVLKEVSEEPLTEFGEECAVTYRVFRRANEVQVAENGASTITVQQWTERKDDRGKTEIVPMGKPQAIRNMTRIPFHPLPLGMQTSEMTAFPALLDLLDSNIAHFRLSTDLRYLMHIGCIPVPIRKGWVAPAARAGEQPREQGFSINTLMDVSKDGGDFWWAEISGAAFKPVSDELKQIEQHMAALGLAFLAAETRSAETAEAKRIDNAAQNATLAASVRRLDDGVEVCLSFHAEYRGKAFEKPNLELSGGEFSTSRDYEATVMDSATMDSYARMQQAGQFTLETFWQLLEQGGRLLPGFDPVKEKTALEKERPVVSLPFDENDEDPNAPKKDADDDDGEESDDEAQQERKPARNAAREQARAANRGGKADKVAA